ncbi:YfhO family protein [Galbibacter mesophilus]|uniref:YfhO family protein n=1 Tax=Galbibacter mesophilus TaxID=379069 RepID=UPI00191FEA22|nr:YfhO family protein [Galbibacter mesophilus]MCM5663528.1 YfhO family protein [Galbibacter mesophilus]
MTNQLKNIVPHFVVFLVFILTSLLYFSPVLQGKKIFQSDIVQYVGMSEERDAFKESTGEESYWTNSAFGGMPTYQLGANYPHNYIKKLDKVIRFLPRPADYLFLYFIGFYLLLLILKVDWKLAGIGALAFGFSTYLIIILGVGHNAKAHAIGYFPFVLAGIILAFRRNYISGFLLTAFAMALEINANHFQMTYYLLLLVLVLGIVYLIDAYKQKELPHFFKAVGVLAVAVVLAVATNATNLMATKEYAEWSTRGKSELTVNPDGSPKENTNGLDKDYITQYSYGLFESLNLFVPRLMGGGNDEELGNDSHSYEYLVRQGVPPAQAQDFVKNQAARMMYWGEQPITAAPAYVGAAVIFLFLMSLFLLQGKLKWWLLAGAIMSLVLSWGHNFELLTNAMIDYFPMYNKFRAITSIQVILELCVPILAILGLKVLFERETEASKKLNALKWSVIISGGTLVLLFFAKGALDFSHANDAFYRQQFDQMGMNQLMGSIKKDREALYTKDIFRSLLFVLAVAAVIWFFIKEKLKQNIAILAFGILILIDLVGIDRQYVNKDDFVAARVLDRPFQQSAIDKQILQDEGYYRVFNTQESINGASTSFYHKSIGGYHAAKPKRLQDLFEYQISKNNVGVLNMLNVKYIIRQNDKGQMYPAKNPYANGPAWFVSNLIAVNSADAEMATLDSLNTKTTAVFNNEAFKDISESNFTVDSTASIKLVDYQPNKLTYESKNQNEGVAVFSEMHYPHGWQVTIDGKSSEEFRVNYALRALKIPAGEHTIVFKFEPQVVKTGSTIGLASNVLLFLLLLGGLFYGWKLRNKGV